MIDLIQQPVQLFQCTVCNLRIFFALALDAVAKRLDNAEIDVHRLEFAARLVGYIQSECADGGQIGELNRLQTRQLARKRKAREETGGGGLDIA